MSTSGLPAHRFLAAAGVDLDKTLAGVLAVMSAEDRAALGQSLAKPLKLEYTTSFDGNVAVEPRTGTEVKVSLSQTISSKPVIRNFDQLQALLGKYVKEPAVQAAVPVLTGLANAPGVPLFKFAYAQTPASVADIAGEAKDMRRQILLAERWAPITLLAVGLLAVLIGGGARLRVSRLKLEMPRGAPSRPRHA